MTTISTEAQRIIDSMAAHQWNRSGIDRGAVESAITQHLAELGLPAQPFVWCETAKDGYAAARSAARSAAWSAARSAAWSAAESAAWSAAESAAESAAWSAARSAAWSAAESAAESAARSAARSAAESAAWSAAWSAARSAAESAARSAAWSAARSAAESAARSAAWSAAESAAEINALSAFNHPAQAKLAAIWLPMEKAFRNGLWLYWITPTNVTCVEQPSLSIQNDRLHRADGPAVEWPAGERYWFWRGTEVPQSWIEDRSSLDAKTALTWPNLEQRRIACAEIVGWSRILAELDAVVIDTDGDPQIGTLVEVSLPDLPRRARFLRVQCGTGREFAVGIPPDVKTAMEAQSWMQGLPPKKFKKPEVRT